MEEAEARVLVVDDDPALRRLMTLALELEGFTVEDAQDGLQALGKLATHEFDVVLLDMRMPRMDGQTCYRAIRAAGNNVPVVVTSVFEAYATARDLGASAALPKPFDPERLVDAVRSALV